MLQVRRILMLLPLAVMLLALQACTAVAAPAEPRQVWIGLQEWRIDPSLTEFVAGVPYRFSVTNAGKIPHHLVVLPRGERDRAKALMEVPQEELLPGATVTRELTFPESGKYQLACHLEWHYKAGMVLPITVQ